MVKILLCSDNGLIKYIPTLLNSISLNNKRVQVYIMLTEVFYQGRQWLLNHCPTNIDMVFIEYSPIINTFHNKHKIRCKVTSNAMFSRIFAPDLFSNIDRMIYMDIDTVVDKDLTELYKWETGKTGIAACLDTGRPTFQTMMEVGVYIDGKCIVDYDPNTKSFNSGVLVMDFETLRKNKLGQYANDILEKQYMTDQPLLNLFCNGDWVEFPIIYNYPANGNRDEWEAVKQDAVIYHWNGKKAWDRQARHNQSKYDEYDILKRRDEWKIIVDQ